MKNKTLTLTVMAMMLVFISLTSNLKAQPGDSKKWTTEQAVDFVACSFVKVSIEREIDCRTLPSPQALQAQIKEKSAGATLSLAEFLDGLKNDKRVKNLSTADVFQFLGKDIFDESKRPAPIDSFLKSPRRKEGQVEKLESEIESALRENLLESDSTTVGSKSEGLSDVAGSGNGNEPVSAEESASQVDDEGWFFGLDTMTLVIIAVVALLALSLGVYAFLSPRKKRSSKGAFQSGGERNRNGGQSESDQRTFRPPPSPPASGAKLNMRSESKVQELESKIQELEKIIAGQRKEIESLKRSVPTPEVSAGYVTPTVDYPQADSVATSPGSIRSLYFPAPTPDGLFDSRYASSSRIEGESLYLLRLISEVEAEVEFDNSRISVNKAKNSPEQILDPVCEGTRSPMNQILGIRMTAPGKARLEGDNWRVYEKVKLTYEY